MDMLFTEAAWNALRAYFEAAYKQLGDLELQGYGKVRMEDGEPVCYEVGIPEQEVSMMKTDATWDQMLAFLQERVDFKDVKKAEKELPTWRLWWHTHGKGASSPLYSGTDEETIRALAAEAGDHMWGLVFHTDSMESSLYLATRRPVPLYAAFGGAVRAYDEVDIPNDISEEVTLKVSKKEFKPTYAPPYTPPGNKHPLNAHPETCICRACLESSRDDGWSDGYQWPYKPDKNEPADAK